MARKPRKRVQQAPARRRVAAPGGQVAAAPEAAVAGRRVGGDEATVRAVEMSLSPRALGAGRRARGGMVLENADPAIPLDRVPFFTSDLARLGVVAVVMLVLLVVGSQLIPSLVH